MQSIPNVTRDALTRVLQTCPPHCRPVLLAVRDHGCGYAQVTQDAGSFILPLDKPAIIIVLCDDLHTSKGPSAFHRPSVTRVLRECGAVYVIASAAEESTYGKACVWPIALRRSVAIIETQPAHEEEWVELVLEVAPEAQITVSKVDPTLPPEPPIWSRA